MRLGSMPAAAVGEAEYISASDCVFGARWELTPPTAGDNAASIGKVHNLQQATDHKGEKWAGEWLEGQPYCLKWPADLGKCFPPFTTDLLIEALGTFKNGTALSWDNVHMKAWLRGGKRTLLEALLHYYVLVESCGQWADNAGPVVVVLLPKKGPHRARDRTVPWHDADLVPCPLPTGRGVASP